MQRQRKAAKTSSPYSRGTRAFNIPALEAAAADYKENVNPDFELEIIEQQLHRTWRQQLQPLRLQATSATFLTWFCSRITTFRDMYRIIRMHGLRWETSTSTGMIFAAEKLDYSTIDGEHYGVPVDNGTVVCAYRTDLLEEAGYTIDDLTGCTWDEFMEIGKAVYDATEKLCCV